MTQPLTRATFSSIGRMVYKLHPDLANSLFEMSQEEPILNDLRYIKQFVIIFCELKNIKKIPKGRTGTTIYLKHVLIMAILKIYNPQILTGYHSPKMMSKLRRELAKHLHLHPNHISFIIPILITRLEVYADFNADVIESHTVFSNYINSNVAK